MRKVRRLADDARAEVSKELGPEFGDVSLRDLNPRTMVRKHLLDPIDLDSLDDDGPRRPAGRAARRPRRRGSAGEPSLRRRAAGGRPAAATTPTPPRARAV